MWWPSVQLAFQTLRANPLRTALSTLGIIMGAASLAAVLSLGDGAEAFARRRLEREGMHVVVLTPKAVDVIDGQRIPRQDIVTFGRADVAAIGAAVGGAHGITLLRRGTVRWQLDAAAPLRAAACVGRLSAGAAQAPSLAAGRDLRQDEMERTAPVALASYALAEAMGTPIEDAVGREILANGHAVRLVGVIARPPGKGTFELVVPDGLSSALMVPTRDPVPPAITVHAPRVEDMPALRSRIDAWVRGRYLDRVSVASRGLETLRDLAQGILIFKLLMGAFTAISLIVGGIGIMNVLLASVIERTREIGVRKAIGARQRDVVLQFLTESVTIAAAGSLVGLSLGLAGAFIATALIRAKTQAVIYAAVSWETIAVSLMAAILTGLCFGVYPALRAARLSPVDAMRYE